jgi:hypothetical protein
MGEHCCCAHTCVLSDTARRSRGLHSPRVLVLCNLLTTILFAFAPLGFPSIALAVTLTEFTAFWTRR